jgi:WD repeat-containing protein 61
LLTIVIDRWVCSGLCRAVASPCHALQSPDGRHIASGAIDGIISVFDVASGKLVHTLEGHAMPIRSLAFSPDSQLLLTASDDGHMKLYDV